MLLSSRRAGSSRVLHPRKSKLCEVKYRTIASKGQVLTNILFLFQNRDDYVLVQVVEVKRDVHRLLVGMKPDSDSAVSEARMKAVSCAP